MVHPGLARELREELSLDVQVLNLLERAPISDDSELSVYLCRSIDTRVQSGVVHDRVRWLSAAELPSVPWLAADRLLVDAVRNAMEREMS